MLFPLRGAKVGHFLVSKGMTTHKATFKNLTTNGGRWPSEPLGRSSGRGYDALVGQSRRFAAPLT